MFFNMQVNKPTKNDFLQNTFFFCNNKISSSNLIFKMFQYVAHNA